MIVFLPGFTNPPTSCWDFLSFKFLIHGYESKPTRYKNLLGAKSIAQNAMEVIGSILKEDEVILIGHSMGGIVGRFLVQNDMVPNVTHLITLGSPHGGTERAKLAPFLHAVKDMTPRSDFLNELNSQSFPGHVKALGITAEQDRTVVPSHRSQARYGENVVVPHVGHAGLIFSNPVFQTMLSWLNS